MYEFIAGLLLLCASIVAHEMGHIIQYTLETGKFIGMPKFKKWSINFEVDLPKEKIKLILLNGILMGYLPITIFNINPIVNTIVFTLYTIGCNWDVVRLVR